MSNLSDTPLVINPITWKGVFVPFIAFLKADPPAGLGKRIEKYRWFSLHSTLLESQLDTTCNSEGIVFDFAKPVAFTPQFGQNTARFTVTGNLCHKDSWINRPLNETNVDYENGILTGYDASNKSNEIPRAVLDSTAKSFKKLLETITGLQVIKLDIANYIYGIKGSHFPK